MRHGSTRLAQSRMYCLLARLMENHGGNWNSRAPSLRRVGTTPTARATCRSTRRCRRGSRPWTASVGPVGLGTTRASPPRRPPLVAAQRLSEVAERLGHLLVERLDRHPEVGGQAG